jgi:hypothetical protein
MKAEAGAGSGECPQVRSPSTACVPQHARSSVRTTRIEPSGQAWTIGRGTQVHDHLGRAWSPAGHWHDLPSARAGKPAAVRVEPWWRPVRVPHDREHTSRTLVADAFRLIGRPIKLRVVSRPLVVRAARTEHHEQLGSAGGLRRQAAGASRSRVAARRAPVSRQLTRPGRAGVWPALSISRSSFVEEMRRRIGRGPSPERNQPCQQP